jgi:hypothetical protein
MRDGIREAILLKDRVEQLRNDVGEIGEKLADHDRRLVRIETIIELARSTRLAKDP